MPTELLDAVKGSPLLLALVVAVILGGYVVERLAGLAGPVSKVLRSWQDRELRKLRREAMLRAERARIDREERSEREHELLDELRAVRADRDRLRRQLDRVSRRRPDDEPTTNPLGRRETTRPPVPGR